jgi:hypothetical protein
MHNHTVQIRNFQRELQWTLLCGRRGRVKRKRSNICYERVSYGNQCVGGVILRKSLVANDHWWRWSEERMYMMSTRWSLITVMIPHCCSCSYCWRCRCRTRFWFMFRICICLVHIVLYRRLESKSRPLPSYSTNPPLSPPANKLLLPQPFHKNSRCCCCCCCC